MKFFQMLFGGGVRQIANGAAEVGRVFVGDRAAHQEQVAAAYQAALGQFGAEFSRPPRTWFDSLVDGINRLPRPILAFSVLGLFWFAMADPVSFAARMQGLSLVPDPLWWIIAAIIGFYFGARETLKNREFKAATQSEVRATVDTIRAIESTRPPPPDPTPPDLEPAPVPASAVDHGNPAIADWRAEKPQD